MTQANVHFNSDPNSWFSQTSTSKLVISLINLPDLSYIPIFFFAVSNVDFFFILEIDPHVGLLW